MYAIADALKTNNVLQCINLYRNIIDVDGARALGEVLKVNTCLTSLDIGHNRIRQTGLKAIVDGVCANPGSKLTSLGIVPTSSAMIPSPTCLRNWSTEKNKLARLFIKANFLTEYHKVALAAQWSEAKSGCFVDAFEAVANL